ncbi:unnamed protein product [Tenebrio molitor]|nr:unnamed protein product [Tenebrio molitor]
MAIEHNLSNKFCEQLSYIFARLRQPVELLRIYTYIYLSIHCNKIIYNCPHKTFLKNVY